MDEYNVDSFTHNVLKKLEDGVLTIFTPTGFKCPFDGKPKDRKRFALAHHAKNTALDGESARVRGSHKALTEYMMAKYEDINPFLPGKNADHHARRKSAKKAKKAKKLKEGFGQDGGQEE